MNPQNSARGLRTRAGFRRRPTSSTGPDRAPFDRPTTSLLSESESVVTSGAIPTTNTKKASQADPGRKIQRGFPTPSPTHARESPPRLIKDSSGRNAARAISDSMAQDRIRAPKVASSTPKPTPPSSAKGEKFPKKLQAFPFVPGATSGELAKAHKFFFLPAEFVKSATSIDMIPENTAIPEVAFIGRSNIGKSSLINGLVNRNGLVKTSSKPGHTRMMNFFKIGERLSLVDMPGYGWKSRDEWGGMILEYLQTRKNLKRIYILVDPSHGLKESDSQIMKLLDGSGLSYQVVLTKVDRLSPTKYTAAKAEVEAALVEDAICCFPMVLGVSSKTKDGLDELRAAIIKAGQLSF
ncbi:GTP-binding protein [Entomortierella parvispora]|uniref:GTP-binding protein 8 n=1 Tax=Entomortierella parvispora TaxID=205924 RepID=A0A9P3LWN9_9FUNG|nr:GTP-binding protein [Entomortierella parvispora]